MSRSIPAATTRSSCRPAPCQRATPCLEVLAGIFGYVGPGYAPVYSRVERPREPGSRTLRSRPRPCAPSALPYPGVSTEDLTIANTRCRPRGIPLRGRRRRSSDAPGNRADPGNELWIKPAILFSFSDEGVRWVCLQESRRETVKSLFRNDHS